MFLDRQEAGIRLADKLRQEALIKAAAPAELLVLSIPRGGVVIGAAIAQALGCAHEIIAVKKLGFPSHRELAMGAMAEDGTLVLSSWVVNELQSGDDYFEQELERVKSQLESYIQKFRQGQRLDLQAKTVILTDDGIATGETMKAALLWSRTQHPKQIIVAVPVCSPRAIGLFKKLADKIVFLAAPAWFRAVGQFYLDFGQVSEAEVSEYLGKSRTLSSAQPAEPIAVG